MAGDLYRAMQRTGGLQPVVDLMTKIQQEREKKQFLDGLFSNFQKSQEAILNAGVNENGMFSPMRGTQQQAQPTGSDLQEENFSAAENTEPIGMNVGAQNNPFSQTPVPLQPREGANNGFLNKLMTGYSSKAVGPQDKYNNAQKALTQFVVENLRGSEIAPEKFNALTQLLSGQVNGLAPKAPNYQQFDPTKGSVYNTSNGLEEVIPGVEKTETADIKTAGTFKGNDGKFYTRVIKDGKIEDIPSSVPFFNDTKGSGGSDEQGNPPKIADDIGELTTLIDRYNNFDNMYDKPLDEAGTTFNYTNNEGETEKVTANFLEANKKPLFSQIKGKSETITRKIDEQVPGFEKSLNKLFDSLTPIKERITKEDLSRKDKRDKIRNVINNSVDSIRLNGQPIPSEIKNWYKTILNSRLF